MSADDHDHGHDDHAEATGIRGVVLGLFRPLSHDTVDTVAGALSGTDEGMRALKISLVVLAVTASVQLVIVAVSGSVALLADSIHNVSPTR